MDELCWTGRMYVWYDIRTTACPVLDRDGPGVRLPLILSPRAHDLTLMSATVLIMLYLEESRYGKKDMDLPRVVLRRTRTRTRKTSYIQPAGRLKRHSEQGTGHEPPPRIGRTLGTPPRNHSSIRLQGGGSGEPLKPGRDAGKNLGRRGRAQGFCCLYCM